MQLGQPASLGFRVAFSRRLTWTNVLMVALLVAASALYVPQAFQNYLYDDEGTYAYAAWRVSAGEVPYRDFLTSEMPVFLYWNGLLVRVLGRSFVPLRLMTVAAALSALCLLYAINRELFGPPTALLSLALLAIEPYFFDHARYLRGDGYMLLFGLAGLYAFVQGERRGQLRYASLAGALFALAALSKLLGLLPLAGCGAHVLYLGWRERRPLRQIALQMLALGLPVLVVAGGAAALFAWTTPNFLPAALGHHMGAGLGLLGRIRKGLALYRAYVTAQPLAVALAVPGVWLLLRRKAALSSLWVWQIPPVLVFVLSPRDASPRYLAYLVPAVLTLLAVTLVHAWRIGQERTGRLAGHNRAGARALALVALAALTLVTVQPWLKDDLRDTRAREGDSAYLTARIQSLASEDERVISDYPGLNFLAGRRSTYWAAEISGLSCRSGQVLGAAFIQEIERWNVAVVIINARGDAHHLVTMPDYASFRRYVQAHFALVETYHCLYDAREFEIYARPRAGCGILCQQLVWEELA